MTKVLEELASAGKAGRSSKRGSTVDNASGSPPNDGGDDSDAQDQTDRQAFPIRDCEQLFAERTTVSCALDRCCVPCAYKIACFDVARDTEFGKPIPNQRPEMCPRSYDGEASSPLSLSKRRRETDAALPYGYRQGMSILTLGDGDLTFSLAIARMLLSNGDDSGSSSHKNKKETEDGTTIVATSFEDEETLRRVYPNFRAIQTELEQLGVIIRYTVDATDLATTLNSQSKQKAQEQTTFPTKFDRIVWNFPCTAIGNGQDGQNQQMEHNKELLRQFGANVQPYMNETTQIHMNHKTKPPYNQWKLQDHVTAPPGALQYVGRIVLDRYLVAPYTPRKALDKKSFPCHDACVYVFEETSNGAINKGDATALAGYDVIPVTRELIQRIRTKLQAQRPMQLKQGRAGSKRRKRSRHNRELNKDVQKRLRGRL